VRPWRQGWILAAPPAFFLALAFAAPLAAIALYALGPQAPQAFLELFTTPYTRNRILFTIAQAAASTLLTLLVGVPAAYVFAHHRFPLRRTLRALFTVPFILPTLVVALGLRALWARGGLIHQWTSWAPFESIGGLGAILVAHVFYNVSLVLRLVAAHWERHTPQLTQAARTLGARPWRLFWHLQLPLAAPAIAASALLVFLFTFTSFGIILLLAGPQVGTIETVIFSRIQGAFPDYEAATLLALLQLAFTTIVLVTYLRLQSRQGPAPAVSATPSPRTKAPAWAWSLLGGLTILLAAPLVALAVASLRIRGQWSLDAFTWLATNQYPLGAYTARTALSNSITFATFTLILALALGTLVAFASHRARPARRTLIDLLHLSPMGLSAVVIGLGITLLYGGRFGIDLRASSARIVLAHVLIAFPFVARIMTPSIHRIGDGLRQAARTLGARPWTVLRRLELPLLKAPLAIAAVYAFAVSLGEFGAALLLRRPQDATLTVAIYDGFSSIDAHRHAQAMALAALLMLMAMTAFLLLERLRGQEAGEFA
jgi:thiamine transport system permease protein